MSIPEHNCECGIPAFFYDSISTGEYIYKCRITDEVWDKVSKSFKPNRYLRCDFYIVDKYNNDVKPIIKEKKIFKPKKLTDKDILFNIKTKINYFKKNKLYSQFQEIELLIKEYNKISNNKIKFYEKNENLSDYLENVLKLF